MTKCVQQYQRIVVQISRPLALLPQVVSAIAAPITSTGDKKENSLGFKITYSCEYFQIQKKRERDEDHNICDEEGG